LGFIVAPQRCVGFWMHNPQITVHVGLGAKCTMRKRPKKTLRSASLNPDEKATSLEVIIVPVDGLSSIPSDLMNSKKGIK